jgi:hypothetical protein
MRWPPSGREQSLAGDAPTPLVAAHSAAEWRVRYERLLARGRAKKEALTILARALLKVVSHLLRTGAAYDPARVGPRAASSPAGGPDAGS